MACYIHVTVWIWTDTGLTQRATYHVPPAGQQILSWSGSSLSPLNKSESAVNLGVPRSLVDPHTGHFGPRWPARSPSFSGFLSPVFVMYASQNRTIENKRPDTVQLGFRFEFTLLQKKIWVYNCVLLSKERSHLFPYPTQSFCLRFGSRHANITILYCSTTNRWTWLTNDALLWDPRGFHNRDRSRNQCYLLSVKDAISHLNIPCFAPLLSQQMML